MAEELYHIRMLDHSLDLYLYNQAVKPFNANKVLACRREHNHFLVAVQLKVDAYKKTCVVESDSEEDMAGLGIV